MTQYKLRMLVPQLHVVGLTIPKDVAQFFSGCYFKIEITKIGKKYGIFCESGNVVIPDDKEIKNYDFSDCRI